MMQTPVFSPSPTPPYQTPLYIALRESQNICKPRYRALPSVKAAEVTLSSDNTRHTQKTVRAACFATV